MAILRIAFLAGLLACLRLSAGDVETVYFTPPQPETTFSLGVYDASGQLVRVLAADAPESFFRAGLNGFEVVWDRLDHDGKRVDRGPYAIRGVAIGEVEVTGTETIGNDWIVSADSPRLSRVERFEALAGDLLRITFSQPDGQTESRDYSVTNGWIQPAREQVPEVRIGASPSGFPGTLNFAAAPGPSGGSWIAGLEFREPWTSPFARASVMLLRANGSIAGRVGASQPGRHIRWVASALDGRRLFVLEEGREGQRLVGMDFNGPLFSSPPEVFLDQSITFERELPSSQVVKIRPKASLLEGQPKGYLSLKAMVHDGQAWLATAGGLPLFPVSAEEGTVSVSLVRDGGGALYYRDDGCAVQVFRLGGLRNMWPVDCGMVELP